MDTKNILVTGGLGFIGHKVVETLQNDHRVVIYDSLTDYGILNRLELDWLFRKRRKSISAQTVVGDITNRGMLSDVFYGILPDVVVHLASFPRAKVVNNDPIFGSQVMINALLDMLLLCKKHNTKRFVYISSSMVYGNFASGVLEDTECAPLGIYAILKYTGELLVKDFCKANGIEYVIIRPSAVYGPLDVEDRVVSKFLLNAMHDRPIVVKGADEMLDFTFVNDTAKGISLATLSKKAANQTYNLTRGVGHSLLEAAQLSVAVTNSKSEIIVANKDLTFPSRGSLSINKAIAELGFKPKVDIADGFELYANWLETSIYNKG